MSKPDIQSSSPSSPAPRSVEISLKKLHPHPKRGRVWTAISADSPHVQVLTERYRMGAFVQEPVVARVESERGFIILDGACRAAAAAAAGLRRMQVTVLNCTSMADALTRMIEMNQSRPKTLLDVAMEVYYCHNAQRKLAKERQRSAGGDRRSATAKGTVPADSAGTVRGETRDLVAGITHQSRERVQLMIALVKKARKQNPKVPRDTKIGQALDLPDADLKAIAKAFSVGKAPDGKAPGGKAPGGKAFGVGKAASEKAASEKAASEKAASRHNPALSEADTLAWLVKHLSVLDDAVDSLATNSAPTASESKFMGAFKWLLASSLDRFVSRIRTCKEVGDFCEHRPRHKKGAMDCRNVVRRWMKGASPEALRAFSQEYGRGGITLAKNLRANNMNLSEIELLAVLFAIMTSEQTTP
jgi:hypothetical protein